MTTDPESANWPAGWLSTRDRYIDLRERLAESTHKHWVHWQQYLHTRCQRQPDGSLVIPADVVATWEHLIATPYPLLTDQEKQSDRDQVDRYWSLIQSERA